MQSLIDFRNGRYQGDIRNSLPDGPGIFFSTELLFIIGHWREGILQGNSIFIYPDATVFCGNLQEGKPQGLCYYQLQRENVKVYFYGDEKKQDGEKNDVFAISVPNFGSVLEVDAGTLAIRGESKVRRGDYKGVLEEVSRILGIKIEQKGREYEGFIPYFEQFFARPYSDLFQQLILNVNGTIQYSIGFLLDGLGIKVRPLPLQQSGGRSYRISEMGVMTRENVLFGVGVKNSNSVLGRVHVQEGVYALPHTLVSYRLSEGPADKTRPVKCMSTFLSFLKRSMTFRDAFLSIQEATTFKQNINRIHESTFTEMKVKNAHEIIESPLKDEAVRAQIQRNRRIRQQESQLFLKSKQKFIQPANHKTGTSILVNPTVNLTSLREELQRSVTKRKLSKSKLTLTNNNIAQYESPYLQPQQQPASKPSLPSSPPKARSPQRANGSITPPRNRKPSYDKKVGLLNSKKREQPLRASPSKYQLDKDVIKEETKPPVPAPILKQPITDSPSKRKVNYRQPQLQQWQKEKLRFTRTNSPTKYSKGSPVKNPPRQARLPIKTNSPMKTPSRPLLTENIFLS